MIVPIWFPDNPQAKIWFTSDQHFGHANIIKFCNRPFENTHFMDKFITEQYNNAVEDDDYVFHLGDLSFSDKKRSREIFQTLKGHKILIRGNHDKEHDGFYLANGFDEVYKSLLLEVLECGDSKHLLLCHKPEDFFNISLILCYINFHKLYGICGHVHNQWLQHPMAKKLLNVGVDQHNFAPISLSKVLETMDD